MGDYWKRVLFRSIGDTLPHWQGLKKWDIAKRGIRQLVLYGLAALVLLLMAGKGQLMEELNVIGALGAAVGVLLALNWLWNLIHAPYRLEEGYKQQITERQSEVSQAKDKLDSAAKEIQGLKDKENEWRNSGPNLRLVRCHTAEVEVQGSSGEKVTVLVALAEFTNTPIRPSPMSSAQRVTAIINVFDSNGSLLRTTQGIWKLDPTNALEVMFGGRMPTTKDFGIGMPQNLEVVVGVPGTNAVFLSPPHGSTFRDHQLPDEIPLKISIQLRGDRCDQEFWFRIRRDNEPRGFGIEIIPTQDFDKEGSQTGGVS